MVWGMPLPSSLGDFWPDGDFEPDPATDTPAWIDRLDALFGTLPQSEQDRLYTSAKGQHSYGYWVSEKLKREPGSTLQSGSPPFSAVLPHEAPKTFVTSKCYASLGSLIQLNDKIIAVDETFKTLIETIEPAKHQFLPIDILSRTGQVCERQFFTLVIGNHLDSFSPQRSRQESFRAYNRLARSYVFGNLKRDIQGLAFIEERHRGLHIWRETCFPGLLTCLSDDLKKAVDEVGLRLPKHFKMSAI
jgi:hypothetical protein